VESAGAAPDATVDAATTADAATNPEDDYLGLLDEGSRRSGLAKNTKSTKVANSVTVRDAREEFIMNSAPAHSEKRLKESIRRTKLHEQSEAAAKALQEQRSRLRSRPRRAWTLRPPGV
jgi:hypothetical protein